VSGQAYYYHEATGQVAWGLPEDVINAPENWDQVEGPDGAMVYHNRLTEEVRPSPPAGSTTGTPDGSWESCSTEDGQLYFYNHVTGESRWGVAGHGLCVF
jgi:hypothetical protein